MTKTLIAEPQTTENYQLAPKGFLGILKGESGEGKSTAAFSFPNAYVFDFDRKMPSIFLKHHPQGDIEWNTFKNIFQIEDELSKLETHCPYETLIVDSITGLVNIVMDSVGEVKNESVPDILRRVTSKSNTIEMMGIDYYSAEDRFCTYFIDRVKGFWSRKENPKHVIIIAHVVTVESAPDLKTKQITKTRSIVAKGRKFPAWLPTGFDDVYIVGRELPDLGDLDQSTKRVIWTEAIGEDSAKCSYPISSRLNISEKNLYEHLKPFIEANHENPMR